MKQSLLEYMEELKQRAKEMEEEEQKRKEEEKLAKMKAEEEGTNDEKIVYSDQSEDSEVEDKKDEKTK